MASVENKVRETISKQIQRGMVDLSVNIQSLSEGIGAHIDHGVAKLFAKEIQKISQDLDMSSGLTGISLLKLPGVVIADAAPSEEAEKELSALILKALQEAIEALLVMRHSEGDKLRKVIRRELEEMQSYSEKVSQHREELNERYYKKLQTRLKDWLEKSSSALDETRIFQEVAFYIDRSDIAEELDRLHSHLKQCEEALHSPDGKSVGKRLDFLAQELGREVNTIGSKSDQAGITNHVVEMKLALERVREQVQNIE